MRAISAIAKTALSVVTVAVLATASVSSASVASPGDTAATSAPSASQLSVEDVQPGSATHLIYLKESRAERVLGPEDSLAPLVESVQNRWQAAGINVTQSFTGIGAFGVRLNEDQARALETDPDVSAVVPNRVRTLDTRFTAQAEAVRDQPPANPGQQSNAVWSVDRIDQRSLPLDGKYRWTHTGKGSTVYVMDSGIRATHQEIAGRVGPGFTAVKDQNGTGDCYGHGTYVASIVAGKTYGVAREATVVPVRFFNCRGSGTDETFLGSLDWLLKNAVSGSILNASWGEVVDAQSTADKTDKIVQNIMARNVTVVAAAGNKSMDSCKYAPARVPEFITVGGTDKSDTFDKSYSNYGSCVDVMAPGTAVTSAWYKNDTDKHTGDGTSASVPFVVGALAIYRQLNPAATPVDMEKWVISQATTGKIKGLPGRTPDRLFYLNPDL